MLSGNSDNVWLFSRQTLCWKHVSEPKRWLPAMSNQQLAESCNPIWNVDIVTIIILCFLCLWLLKLNIEVVSFCSLLLNFSPLLSSESKFVQFLSGYVYRGRCEILPCRAGPGPRPPAQPGHSLQRSQAREVRTLDLTFTSDPSHSNQTVIFPNDDQLT